MRILVTGGAGYIGSHFLKELRDSKNKYEVLVVDNLSNGFKENIIFGKLVVANLLDKEKIQEIVSEFKPELIVHFAAFISVPESVKNPLMYYENNFIGSLNLIDAAVKNNVNKFIFSSTAAVYGMPEESFISEKTKLKPINPYGNSKKMVEELLKDIKISKPEFNYVCLRYFNVAGNDPNLEVGNRQKKFHNVIPIILDRIKKGKNEIDIFGNDWSTPDKTCIRDYIHVTDLVKAHISVIDLLNNTYTFNVGYGKGSSVIDVVDAVDKVCNVKIKRNFVARREGDPEQLIADSSLLKELTDWKPLYDDLDIIVKSAWNLVKRNE